MLKNLGEKHSLKCGSYYNSKWGIKLERDVYQAQTNVLVRCPQTTGHIVFIKYITTEEKKKDSSGFI